MSRRVLAAALAIGLASSAAGCTPKPANSAPATDSAAGSEDTGPPGDPCLPGADPWLLVGEGETGFSYFDPGDPVELVHGPQGGYHVTMAIRAGYLDNSAPWIVRLDAYIGDDLVAQSVPYANAFCNPSASALDAWNLLLIFNEDLAPEELHGQIARVDVSVTDAALIEVEASNELTITDPSLE